MLRETGSEIWNFSAWYVMLGGLKQDLSESLFPGCAGCWRRKIAEELFSFPGELVPVSFLELSVVVGFEI